MISDSDSFVLYDGNGYGTQWYQDNYLTRFINESKIFQNDASDYTVHSSLYGTHSIEL